MSKLSRLKISKSNRVSLKLPPTTSINSWFLIIEKRSDRRVEISRPKKGITFALDNNMTREFRIADIVQKDELAKSAERNVPKTPGRLVKLKPTESAEADNAANQSDEDTKVSFNEDKDEKSDDVACVGEARAASPVIAESEQTAHTGTIATQCDEPVDNQSGDGSDQAERESGEEDNTMMDAMPMVLPTLSHIDSRVC